MLATEPVKHLGKIYLEPTACVERATKHLARFRKNDSYNCALIAREMCSMST